MTRVFLSMCVLLLAACASPTPPYAVSISTNKELRTLNPQGVEVAEFLEPTDFNPVCRAGPGTIKVADGLTHAQYIRKAFRDELDMAGGVDGSQRVKLMGVVNRLEFASANAGRLLGGSWTIGLTLVSSNGKMLNVSEFYQFDSNVAAVAACSTTAQAFSKAVQELVAKAVHDPAFRELIS